MKSCTNCGNTKSLNDFPTNKKMRDGRSSWCKQCYKHYRTQNKGKLDKWRENNPTYDRDRKRLTKYGLSPEDYDYLLSAQSGVCAICLMPPKDRSLAVDHDHGTGQVRGLLCATCNVGLGMFGDSTSQLLLAVEYLRRYKDTNAKKENR